MKSGLYWQDSSALALRDKIQQGATCYYQKYGTMPDTVQVNPHQMPVSGAERRQVVLNTPAHAVIAIVETIRVPGNIIWLGEAGK